MTSFLLASLSLVLVYVSLSDGCYGRCNCTSVDGDVVAHCEGKDISVFPILMNPKISALNLRANTISHVSLEEIGVYPRLRFLDLSFNRLFQLDKGLFYRLQQLEILRLNGNSIENLNIETFAGLENLKILDLSENRQHRIATSIFADLGKIEVLNLSSNSIKEVSPGGLTGLVSLKELHLQNNGLTTVPKTALRATPALKMLDLSFNELKRLPNESFVKLEKIQILNLRGNSIEFVDINAFVGLRSLIHLDLSYNRLFRIPTLSFRPLTELTNLQIGGNLLDALPTSSFEGLRSLRQLSVDYCSKLRSVDLNAFSGLGDLESLRLDRNPSLTSIHPMAFEEPTNVRHLFMSNNALTSLPENLLDWSQIQILDLRNNPWDCDCDFTWISAVLYRVYVGKFSHDSDGRSLNFHAKCETPSGVKHMSLEEFPLKIESSCSGNGSNQTRLIVTISVVLAALFTVTVIVVAIFMCRKQIFANLPIKGKSSPLYARSEIMSSSDYENGFVPSAGKRSLLYAGFVPGGTINGRKQLYTHSGSPEYYYHSITPTIRTASSTVSGDGGSFRVIKDYPVPITEL